MSVYLELFNGRNTPTERLDDWGFEGPILGPFEYVHTTYAANIVIGDGYLSVVNDLVYYDGKYYGDWSVFAEDTFKKMPASAASRLQPFDPQKAAR